MTRALSCFCLASALVLPMAVKVASLTTLYTIPSRNDGAQPLAALLNLNGKLYGATPEGGAENLGAVYSVNSATGAEKLIYSFTGGADGSQPEGPLVAVDGMLYGTASQGGTGGGYGTIYKIDPTTGSETILYSFGAGALNGEPQCGLLLYDGMLYGVAAIGGDSDNGYVFRVDPGTGSETTLYSFQGASQGDASYPTTALVRHHTMLYGTTYRGGKADKGAIYRIDPATGEEKTLHSFGSGTDGQDPQGSLVETGGKFYGTTFGGGQFNQGTVFVFDPAAHTESALYNFQYAGDGGLPWAGLLNYGGLLYGTTNSGGPTGLGTVFSIDPATSALTTVHAFSKQEGGYSRAALIERNGILYGATQYSTLTQGAAFALEPASGNETTLHVFLGTEDSQQSALIKVHGALYGTASAGGDSGAGSIFKVDPRTGTAKTIYSFNGGADGASPSGALLDLNGTLYGVTRYGGTSYQGTVFSFDPSTRTQTTLYSFTGGSDGAQPRGTLIELNGLFYGTASTGGASNDGTVFTIDPSTGAQAVVYSFAGGKSDGGGPAGGVIYANNLLYGTTMFGGARNSGTLFQVDPVSTTESVLYSFTGGADGISPLAGLLYDSGALYGATSGFGVRRNNGTVFKFDTVTGTETVLQDFQNYAGPQQALIKRGGSLYGTVPHSHAAPYGSVFQINLATGKLHTVYNFSGGTDGGHPTSSLLNVAGVLYGTTNSVTSANAGTVFGLAK